MLKGKLVSASEQGCKIHSYLITFLRKNTEAATGNAEAVNEGVLQKNAFFKILQTSQENTCVWGLFLHHLLGRSGDTTFNKLLKLPSRFEKKSLSFLF